MNQQQQTNSAREDLISRVSGRAAKGHIRINGYITPEGLVYSDTKPQYGLKATATLTDDPEKAKLYPYLWEDEDLTLCVIVSDGFFKGQADIEL